MSDAGAPESEPAPLLDEAAFERLAMGGVPFVGQLGCTVVGLGYGRASVRLPYHELLLRPGGTICGPAIMALADITLYGVVLSMIGEVALTVTTDIDFRFLRKPRPGPLIAHGRILRLGRVLAVGEVEVVSEGGSDAVAVALGTYAIPPNTPGMSTPARSTPAMSAPPGPQGG